MQWLINIITELFTDRHRYFDRGDPATRDFSLPDFVQDNTWRDLDLSAIIPANVVAVHLRVVIKSAVIDQAFNLRTNGNANAHNVVRVSCAVANIRNSVDVLVSPDSNGVIEYKCLFAVFTLLSIAVAGWWLR